MNFSQFLTFRYYISPAPSPDFRYATLLLIIGAVMIIGGIALRIYRKRFMHNEILKKMMRRYPRFFEIFGGIIIILVLVRSSGIPYISMRLWWGIYGLLFLYFAVSRLMNFKKEYKARQNRMEQNQRLYRFFKK